MSALPSADAPPTRYTTVAAGGATATDRVLATGVAVIALGLLIAVAFLTPDPTGSGTHTQLGLPPCGFYLVTRYPCPTCGMTTAFAHAVHLQPRQAFIAHPFGALLALGTAVVFWGALHVAVFGSNLGRIAVRLLRPRTVWLLAAAALASWAYKIAAEMPR